MKIAVVAETRPGERRVALVPSLVPRLTEAGQDVVIEPGAGQAAGFTDDDYRAAGAGEVLVWGGANVPSQLPAQASQLYSTNVVNLLLLTHSDGDLRPGFDDEIIAGCCVTHAGEVRHAPTRDLLGEDVS